jgi:hypothetical protein
MSDPDDQDWEGVSPANEECAGSQHVCRYRSGVGTSVGVNDQLEGPKGPQTGHLLAYSSASGLIFNRL